jgi:tRNA nucleotidyltransferase (CCA-adding enzyme)
MKTYLVGGAVRDKLLGLPVKDRDWVVVGASIEDMLERKFRQVGREFPVFLHPQTNEEHALARTERKIGPGHRGFEFDSSAEVTLEEDLVRRDLTVNAIAESEDGEIIDPYGGPARSGKPNTSPHLSRLRGGSASGASGCALRGAFRPARLLLLPPETLQLMTEIVDNGELAALTAERVWRELQLALGYQNPDRFVQVLRDCGALKVVLPEVDALFGVPQPEKYHPEIDTGIHVLLCLQQICKLSDDLAARYATLVHDVGKGITPTEQWPSHIGHEKSGLGLLDAIESRLPVPKEFAALSRMVCEHHTKLHRIQELRPKTLLGLLESLDAMRRPERIPKFLAACEADARGRTGLENRDYPQGHYLQSVLNAVLDIDSGKTLADSEGGDPKKIIEQTRLKVITETVDRLRNEQATNE